MNAIRAFLAPEKRDVSCLKLAERAVIDLLGSNGCFHNFRRRPLRTCAGIGCDEAKTNIVDMKAPASVIGNRFQPKFDVGRPGGVSKEKQKRAQIITKGCGKAVQQWVADGTRIVATKKRDGFVYLRPAYKFRLLYRLVR